MRSPLGRVKAAMTAMVGIARTTAPMIDGPIGAYQVRFSGLELKDATPYAQHYGFASSLPVGADKIVVSLMGQRTKGVAIASNHQQFRPRGLAVGEAMMHDNAGQAVYLRAGQTIDLKSATGFNFYVGGKLVGTLSASGFALEVPLTTTGNVIAEGVGLHEHVHTGVQPGTGMTGAPEG